MCVDGSPPWEYLVFDVVIYEGLEGRNERPKSFPALAVLRLFVLLCSSLIPRCMEYPRFLLFFSFLYLFMLYSFCKCMMIFFFLAFRSLFSLFLSSLSPQFLSLSPSPLANSSFSPLPRPSIPISLKYRQLRQQKYNPPSPPPPCGYKYSRQ